MSYPLNFSENQPYFHAMLLPEDCHYNVFWQMRERFGYGKRQICVWIKTEISSLPIGFLILESKTQMRLKGILQQIELMLLSNKKGRENFRHRQLVLFKIIKTEHFIYPCICFIFYNAR